MRCRLARRASALLLAAFLALPAAAQQVWIVDAAGGAGSSFTDLPAAVAGVNPGDILVVRPGQYTAIVVDRGLTILAEPGAEIVNWTTVLQIALRVENLPAGETFVCSGLGFLSANLFLTRACEIVSCAGEVHLEDLHIDRGSTFLPLANAAPALQVVDSPRVRVVDSRLRGVPGVLASNSSLVIVDSECLGADGFSGHGESPSGYGISAASSEVTISRGTVRGGSFNFLPPVVTTPGTAIESQGSSWTVLGDETTRVDAGYPGSNAPLEAVVGTGTLVANPAVTFTGSNAGAFGPGIQASTAEIPSMRAAGAPLGGTVQLDLFGLAGQPYAFFVGLPGPPVPIGTAGSLYMDLGLGPIFFNGGTVPAGRHVQASAAVPSDPLILGARFTWQGLVLEPASGALFLSNPAPYVHD